MHQMFYILYGHLVSTHAPHHTSSVHFECIKQYKPDAPETSSRVDYIPYNPQRVSACTQELNKQENIKNEAHAHTHSVSEINQDLLCVRKSEREREKDISLMRKYMRMFTFKCRMHSSITHVGMI